jgi:NAD-dependent dihydropyrimidine dehydrogenase PreA subunit
VYFIEPSMCIDCGACGVICPDEAILDTFGNLTHVLKKAERPIAVVHPDNCNGCGVCIDVCPFDSLFPSPGNGPEYLGRVEVNEKSCVGCKLCEEVCGWEGVYIMPLEEKTPFLESLGYEPEAADA